MAKKKPKLPRLKITITEMEDGTSVSIKSRGLDHLEMLKHLELAAITIMKDVDAEIEEIEPPKKKGK